jgi:hypothetical protein
MKSFSRALALVSSALAFSACAGVHTAPQFLAIASKPDGAAVRVSNGASCTTPCRIDMVRSDYLQITFQKTGCITQTQMLPPPYAAENAARRAAAEIRPNSVFVALSCGA